MRDQASKLFPIAIVTLLGFSGCEPVDDGAASRTKGWEGTLSTVLLPGDRGVFLGTDETDTASDGCGKTVIDAHAILTMHCAQCHANGAASRGNPLFDFVLDDQKMIDNLWTREGQPPLHFLIPGDADNSMIYVRASVRLDMPPTSGSVDQPDYPRVTFSEGSVLREWIEKCMGVAGPLAGGGPGGGNGAAGAAGSGGASGIGGAPGAGGAAGTAGTTADAGIGDSGDGGTTLQACAGGVNNGGGCNAGAQPCTLQAQTYTCLQQGGMARHAWSCN